MLDLWNTTKVIICALALNEQLYIDEWIIYHKLLGFDFIQVYDNSRDYDMQYLRHKFDHYVHIDHLGGERVQKEAYIDCTEKYGEKNTWAAFIDIDEFIILRNHVSIKYLLQDYAPKDGGALGLNWYLYGSSHHKNYTDEPGR
jgi:hypothetical protein